MSKEVKVILELSDDVQTLLEEQGIDLYQELQQELPSIHLQIEEIETRHPDGTTTIQRKRVLSSNESRSIEQPVDQQTPAKPAISEATKETKGP